MYRFNYQYLGGAIRVQLQTGEDLRHLAELDPKQWTVLSCPAHGLEISEESMQFIDLDHDGQIHLDEIIRASEWLSATLKDLDSLFLGKPEIAISDIQDSALAEVATTIAPDILTLETLDNYIAAIAIPSDPIPAAPYADDIIAAYKAKKDEYAAYFQQIKLHKLGLATIAEDTPVPGMTVSDFLKMGDAISAWETAVADINARNAEAQSTAIAPYLPLRKLLLLSRDFVTMLHNFISLDQFYERHVPAIFQAGTLVIDQRICHLCLYVHDMTKHNAQAAMSGLFLVYCDCYSRKLDKKIQIVAAVTLGDIKNLKEGKNAIFYDRQGNDYDATITKVIDNPISVGQAFWSPYRKFGNWIQELINKSAIEKDDQVFNDITSDTQQKIEDTKTAATAEAPQKSAFDIAKFAGIFAAIGMALGYIGAFLTSLASGINELRWWELLIWIAGIILVISGPAMIVASIKLHRRNLAPLLNANGWAVNADAFINIPFGATLTEKVQYPLVKLKKEKKSKRNKKH